MQAAALHIPSFPAEAEQKVKAPTDNPTTIRARATAERSLTLASRLE